MELPISRSTASLIYIDSILQLQDKSSLARINARWQAAHNSTSPPIQSIALDWFLFDANKHFQLQRIRPVRLGLQLAHMAVQLGHDPAVRSVQRAICCTLPAPPYTTINGRLNTELCALLNANGPSLLDSVATQWLIAISAYAEPPRNAWTDIALRISRGELIAQPQGLRNPRRLA